MSETPAARPSRAIPAAIILLLAVNVGGISWLIHESKAMRSDANTRLIALERVVRVMRYEATTQYEGMGFNALLDHLQYWAPWLRKTKQVTDRFFVEDRLRDIVETMSFLPDAYAPIEAAFLSVEASASDTTSDVVREQLLVAAHLADPAKAVALMSRVLEGKDLSVGLPLRRFAASQLLQADKVRAGEVLHKLLLDGIKSGAVGRVGSQSNSLHPRQTFNYVDDFVASGHPEVEKTLIRILQRSEYQDPYTVQRCVEHLGNLKSRAAVGLIKKLCLQETPFPGQIPNPIFRRKCMIAVVDAIGAEAVPFLKKIDLRESDAGIRAKLNEYKKQFDFSK